MPPKSMKDKMEAEVRKIARLDGNKICADCTERMPGYVNTTHAILVCTRCSGIHRELQFKIKGISMSEFSKEDVDALARGGNNAHNAKYLARHTARDHAIPDGTDVNKLRDFIKSKYVDKRWYSDDGVPHPAAAHSEQHKAVPAPQHQFGDQNGQRKAEPAKPLVAEAPSLFDPFDSSPPAAAPQAAPASSGFGDFDPFGSVEPAAAPQSAPQSAPVAPSFNNQWDAFGAPAAPVSAPVSNQWDAFSSAPAAAPTQAPGGNQWDAFNAAPVAAPAPVQPAPANGFGGGFDPFGSAPAPTHVQQHPNGYLSQAQPQHAPPAHVPAMPFVKLHKEAEAAPSAEEPASLSGFSAFDALSVEDTASVHSTGSSNPFGAPPASEPHQYNSGYPVQQQQGGSYPPQQQQPGYGQPQGGYPNPNPGYNGYSNGGGYGYPPQQQQAPQQNGNYGGYPQSGQYPQVPPGGYGQPQPQGGYGQPQGGYGQPQGGYGYPAQGQPNQYQPHGEPAAHAAPPVAPPAAPDPFADMAANAWGASGGKPQQPRAANSFGGAPPAPAPQAPPASVNPFDLF